MTYTVEIEQSGRGGTIRYVENGEALSFDWEFAMDGADVFVPAAEQWDTFCAGRNAGWAKGRRSDILERVAAEVREQKAKCSTVTIDDTWIHFAF